MDEVGYWDRLERIGGRDDTTFPIRKKSRCGKLAVL